MGRNKRAIEDHFDGNYELEASPLAEGKDAQADMVHNIILEGVECILVHQAEQLVKRRCEFHLKKKNY